MESEVIESEPPFLLLSARGQVWAVLCKPLVVLGEKP